jgi:ElaB/YqjD/DUF883 family membrane-anchored ribosome-binding protein
MATSTTAYPGTDENSTGTVSESAERESRRVLDKLREKTDAVVESMQPQLAAVSDYARNEPTKAVLIAAASGAALMAVVTLLARSGGHRAAEAGEKTMAAIRKAAMELADRGYDARDEAIDGASRRVKRAREGIDAMQKAAEDLQKRAGETADSVADTVSETWESLREQAAPVIKRFQPQIDAVASYAKEDPTRAVLGVATAGAILFGLMSLLRSSDD